MCSMRTRTRDEPASTSNQFQILIELYVVLSQTGCWREFTWRLTFCVKNTRINSSPETGMHRFQLYRPSHLIPCCFRHLFPLASVEAWRYRGHEERGTSSEAVQIDEAEVLPCLTLPLAKDQAEGPTDGGSSMEWDELHSKRGGLNNENSSRYIEFGNNPFIFSSPCRLPERNSRIIRASRFLMPPRREDMASCLWFA
jgi:hypothetical protein